MRAANPRPEAHETAGATKALSRLAWARRRQLELAMEGRVLASAEYAKYAKSLRRRARRLDRAAMRGDADRAPFPNSIAV